MSVSTVESYIAAQPVAVRAVLQSLRDTIRAALPEAEEGISYQIPVYKLQGKAVIFFAGWQKHISVYPASDGVIAEFAAELARYKVSRGTIRFPLSEPLPLPLIAGIARVRAGEVAAGIIAADRTGR